MATMVDPRVDGASASQMSTVVLLKSRPKRHRQESNNFYILEDGPKT